MGDSIEFKKREERKLIPVGAGDIVQVYIYLGKGETAIEGDFKIVSIDETEISLAPHAGGQVKTYLLSQVKVKVLLNY